MATEGQKTMIENIQYFHDCWDVAQQRRDALRAGKPFKLFDYEMECMPRMDDEELMFVDNTEDTETPQIPIQKVSEQKIESARLEQRSDCDRAFARQAMQLAQAANIFGDEYHTTVQRSSPVFLQRATHDDVRIFDTWETILKEMTRKQHEEEGQTNISRTHLYSDAANVKPTLQLEHNSGQSSQDITDHGKEINTSENTSNNRLKLSILNSDQRRAHDKIEQHMFNSEYEKSKYTTRF
jgi:hypothetical protein